MSDDTQVLLEAFKDLTASVKDLADAVKSQSKTSENLTDLLLKITGADDDASLEEALGLSDGSIQLGTPKGQITRRDA